MPFEPNAENLKHMLKFKENHIPQYFFRICTPASTGTTTTSYVIPPAAAYVNLEVRLDIFKEPYKGTADALSKHFVWTETHEKTCNFTSWPLSLQIVDVFYTVSLFSQETQCTSLLSAVEMGLRIVM